jgi:hypothetical protein
MKWEFIYKLKIDEVLITIRIAVESHKGQKKINLRFQINMATLTKTFSQLQQRSETVLLYPGSIPCHMWTAGIINDTKTWRNKKLIYFYNGN